MKKQKIEILKAYKEMLLEVKKIKKAEELKIQQEQNELEFKPKVKVLSLFK